MAARDACSKSQIGYDPAAVMNSVENTKLSDYAESTTRGLTKVRSSTPSRAASTSSASCSLLGAGFVGSFLASMVALLAFLVTCVILIIDFVLFSIVKSNINDDGSGSNAYYSAAAWTILVAGICLHAGHHRPVPYLLLLPHAPPSRDKQ